MKYICRKPGPKSVKIIAKDSRFVSPSLTREYSFVYKKAKGCSVWDEDGRKYLDFAAGVAVMNTGHNNPGVIRAVKNQLKFGVHCGFSDFYARLPVEFAEKLVTFLPKPLGKVFLSNSGTEAVECAYKLARWHTKRKWTIAFKNAFHGRTMGSLSMTNAKPVQRERYAPFLPVKHVPYPYWYRMGMEPGECSNYCLAGLERTIRQLDGDCASLFIEPVQGEGGYVVPPADFVRGARKLCNEYGVLLCADEVQSGCFRTGKFLAISNFNVKADVVSLSKAIGGGVPLGATVSSPKIMDWVPGSHANTFGGNLLACAAGIASLNYMKRKKLGQNALRTGKFMMRRLDDMKEKYEFVGDVRGIGLMIGVELVHDKASRKPGIAEREFVLCRAAEKGLILLGAGKSTIRICPPLIITRSQAEHGLDILEDSFRMLHHRT